MAGTRRQIIACRAIIERRRADQFPTAPLSIAWTPPISATTLFGKIRVTSRWTVSSGARVARTGCSAGTWRFRHGERRRARDEWVFTGQIATPAQIEMLKSRDLIPTRAARTTTFTNLGVPHGRNGEKEVLFVSNDR